MADPVTIGTLSASTLAMAAEATIRASLEEAAKDAYKSLKDNIAQWASGDVRALAVEPGSNGRQIAIAEKIDQQPVDDQATIQTLTVALIDALKENARTSPIGIHFGRLEVMRVQLGTISVTAGVGVRIKVNTSGDFTVGAVVTNRHHVGSWQILWKSFTSGPCQVSMDLHNRLSEWPRSA
jgi:hypothetical protein